MFKFNIKITYTYMFMYSITYNTCKKDEHHNML